MGQEYSHLSAEERGVIMAMKAQGHSGRAIAMVLGRSSSTVVRELRRNGHVDPWAQPRMGRPRLPYDGTRAGQRALRLRRKPCRSRKLRRDSPLWQQVCRLLGQGWSPQQVSRTLRRLYPDQPTQHVSHETIYTAIYATPRGAMRRELVQLLRQHKCARRPRGQGANRRGQLADLPSIHVRPPEAEERLAPGHWEGDFIKGARNRSAVGVLVDRTTLYVILARMEGCSALHALDGFTHALKPLPVHARQTLTYDQGKEMALHRVLSQRTGVAIYFADPRSPWQRGICENTNGLLRQYLPKGADLSIYSQQQLDAIAQRLNHRPRATLGYHCPAEMFMRLLGHHELADRIDGALLS
ncbi:IS30 family transposase [Lysobacter sp. Root983]|uniref:IS30 family transposase n=1 Tax=Lysobacter sp. Root983 TaxID=1736613 RepID=UPI00070AD7E8|nr:IS30 family transposase [Lysobacter sp. Root983]KRD75717.1 transcriptional regulator [Lysobacter sp. Root983]